MYGLKFSIKSFFLFFILSCSAQENEKTNYLSGNQSSVEKQELVLGAERTELYLPILEGKKVGIVANQTSVIGNTHLLDTLLSRGIDVVGIFTPEHGFRGDADAGEKIDSSKDGKTGVDIISLYGKNKKPSPEQLQHVDYMLFDIQDVGARFYTYISTLHYVMEACAKSGIEVIVLDRPNPNGHYVDGPLLQEGFTSFVGMHPVPIVHGMTIGEYAQMINGEGWLKDKVQCSLQVISCINYSRYDTYDLPIPPSPNLRSRAAIQLYPSLCLFEGTVISEGRGTVFPFEIFGHPNLPSEKYDFQFVPESSYGAKHPKLKDQKCNGLKLSEIGEEGLSHFELKWLVEAYQDFEGTDFFIIKNRWFDILAGTDELRKSIEKGMSIEEIRSSWENDLEKFKSQRRNYLIYEE